MLKSWNVWLIHLPFERLWRKVYKRVGPYLQPVALPWRHRGLPSIFQNSLSPDTSLEAQTVQRRVQIIYYRRLVIVSVERNNFLGASRRYRVDLLKRQMKRVEWNAWVFKHWVIDQVEIPRLMKWVIALHCHVVIDFVEDAERENLMFGLKYMWVCEDDRGDVVTSR